MCQIRTSVGAKSRQVSQRNPPKWLATAQCRKKTARQFQFQQCAADSSPTGESNQQKGASILAASQSGSERRAWSLAFPDGQKDMFVD
jgi:hypothetical protein